MRGGLPGPSPVSVAAPPGTSWGAMHAEYQVPEWVPDVPAMPDTPPARPGSPAAPPPPAGGRPPADPTLPGGAPEPMDIAVRFSRRGTMRILSRFSILVLALFLALAPTFALAQTTGGGGTGGTGTTSGTTSGTSTTTTTTTTDPNANGAANYP